MEARLAAVRYRITRLLRGHQAFVILLALLLLLVASAIRINALSNKSVDQFYIDQKKVEIKSVQFNEEAVKQIEALKDSNVQPPGTNLPVNRQNPFSE